VFILPNVFGLLSIIIMMIIAAAISAQSVRQMDDDVTDL